MRKPLQIIIGGDFAPTLSNYDLFCSGDVDTLFGSEILNLLSSSDVRIFNLETPLISKKSPIKKCGPNIGIDEKVIKGIKKLNPSCLGLANNHIMDHDREGFENTLKVLKNNDIEFCGIGTDFNHLRPFIIKDVNNFKIGIYACAEHEFSIATNTKCGVNPFDSMQTYYEIMNFSKKCDFLIVLYHGGKEFYPYPSPKLQNYCHKFIDSGADFVVCQHSHCIGCEENYRTKKIVYGQGNFIFDDGTNTEQWNSGLLIRLSILKAHAIESVNYYVHDRCSNCVRLADKNKTQNVLNDFFDRSKQIVDQDFIEKQYKKFSDLQMCTLLRKFDLISSTFLFRFFNKITRQRLGRFYFKKLYLKNKSYDLQNILECEAWHEMALQVVKNYNNHG